MPAFPITIDVPESSNPQDLGFTDQLGSAEGQSKSSVQNTVPVQQPQDSQEATERDDTDAEEPAFEVFFTYSAVTTLPPPPQLPVCQTKVNSDTFFSKRYA